MKVEEDKMQIKLEQEDMFKACSAYVERMGFVLRPNKDDNDTTVTLHCDKTATPGRWFSADVNIQKPTNQDSYRSPPQEK